MTALLLSSSSSASSPSQQQGTSGTAAGAAGGGLRYRGHRLVAVAWLEVIVRYVRFVQQHPQYIPAALDAFLGPWGVGHGNSAVAGRAAYLLMRVVKVLRQQLLPLLDSILMVWHGVA
ncbi:unnamed protein product, partial [Closterium sp. NIES-53]